MSDRLGRMPSSATFNAFRAVLGVSIAAGAVATAGASAAAHAASVSLPSAAAALLDSGPGIGDQLPAPILATAVRGHMPSFRELGVTYVLVFMNSSDAPSRQALPVMDGLAQRFGKKVGVVAISDEPVSIVREFASSPD